MLNRSVSPAPGIAPLAASALAFGLALLAFGGGAAPSGPSMTLELTSSAFSDGASIPRKYTCEGDDLSPPLAWTGAPAGTRSFVLIVDDPDAPDPDAPRMTWVHWVLHNPPPGTRALAKGTGDACPPAAAQARRHDWRRADYKGPCLPIGRHRALCARHRAQLETTRQGRIERAMKGHVLAAATLMGTYAKER